MSHIQHRLWQWLPLAITITILAGLVYIAVQQDLRQGADDPQIELAEDASLLLASGQSPQIFGPTGNVDFSKSLVPFILVYDDTGKPLSGTATLHGNIPVPPSGVFDVAKNRGENRLTWEPEHGVRIAAIVDYVHGSSTGYVLAGRSLREVEKREDRLMFFVFVAWVVALVSTCVIYLLMPSYRE